MQSTDHADLLATLQARFDKNMARHRGVAWDEVLSRLNEKTASLAALQRMEDTGGEPDVIARAGATGVITFCDCSAESPAGRRSLCFDAAALAARKENKPAGSASAMAQALGIALLTPDDYRQLQQLGQFDRKTSSWLATPEAVRTLGGALFGDRRYGQVFIYHNGAESYYAARGFRGLLHI